MLAHLSKAIAQLGDPRLRRVMVVGITGTAVIFVALSVLVWWLFSTQVDLTGLTSWEWLQELINWMAGFLVGGALLIVSLLLFPGVATIIVGFFLEDVVSAVEERHYPGEPTARPQPVPEVVLSTVKFALVVVGLNLLFLPVYVLLFFVPPLNVILYYLLNGHLVSREYFELVAFRRLEPAVAAAMRRRNRGRLLLGGVLLTFLLTIPVVNFITPVVAAAFMVHLFQSLPGRQDVLAP